jgi:AcrR family transcriptional regulator
MTMPSPPEGKRPRGRPNDATIDTALLKAAYEEFVEKGYHGMSMDAIAARAGVSKVSLYRRWDSKAAIAAEVFRTMSEEEPPIEADSLDGCVRALIRSAIGSPGALERGKLVLRTVGEVTEDPELLAVYRDQLFMPGLAQMRDAIELFRERGEVAADTPTDAACALVAGPLLLCYLAILAKADLRLEGDISEQVARLVLDGIRAKAK